MSAHAFNLVMVVALCVVCLVFLVRLLTPDLLVAPATVAQCILSRTFRTHTAQRNHLVQLAALAGWTCRCWGRG